MAYKHKDEEIDAALYEQLDDRQALNGILYVLRTGTAWERLPQKLGFGSGMTCWRRLRDWQSSSVWEKLHLRLLAELRGADQLDFSRFGIDGAGVASPGGQFTGPNPTDRGKNGSKRHLIVEGNGLPMTFCITVVHGALRHPLGMKRSTNSLPVSGTQVGLYLVP